MTTDPMTPVRALIEAAKRADSGKGDLGSRDAELRCAALNATASISQLLSEHDKVVALEKELRKESKNYSHDAAVCLAKGAIADRLLAAIVEGK